MGGGKSLRLAELHPTEDAIRLVSTGGGSRGDYFGETIHASRTTRTRRLHQRIAQQTGLDRKTVRRHLAAGIQPPTYGPRASRGSLIDAYTEYLQARIAHYPGLSAQRLLREIQAQGYTGGYATLTAYLHTIRPPKESGYEVRFETPAGHQAQVDFAHFKVRFPV